MGNAMAAEQNNESQKITEMPAVRFRHYEQNDDESWEPLKMFDFTYQAAGDDKGVEMDEISSAKTEEGSAVGSGTTTVVVAGGGGAPAAQDPFDTSQAVSIKGIDGVVSNPFAKEEIVKVDVEPNLRRDVCLETYCCTSGCAWFFKMPDCLGAGYMCMWLLGMYACTTKILQKPTFCEFVCACAICDMSTCCSNKGENDMTCCTFCNYQYQATWCCILQNACKCEYGLMRTLIRCWSWCLICDTRCACPPSSFAPLQFTCCGFGYRCSPGGGFGFRMRGDESNVAPAAAAGGGTTVVVVNN